MIADCWEKSMQTKHKTYHLFTHSYLAGFHCVCDKAHMITLILLAMCPLTLIHF